MTTKSLKVQITLPKELVDKIDEDAKAGFVKRSAWFERAARMYFENNTERKKIRPKTLDLDI